MCVSEHVPPAAAPSLETQISLEKIGPRLDSILIPEALRRCTAGSGGHLDTRPRHATPPGYCVYTLKTPEGVNDVYT